MQAAQITSNPTNPKSRLVNELLDYRHHRFDFGNLDELQAAVDEYRQHFEQTDPLEVADVSLICRLLLDLVEPPDVPRPGRLQMAPPDLPSAEELLDGLA